MKGIKTFITDSLTVHIYETEAQMGAAAAADAAAEILRLQKTGDEINIIFAAAVSQDEFLNALGGFENIDWGRINAFHMDEYHGIPAAGTENLSHFLCERFLDKVCVGNRFFLNSETPDLKGECARYSALLQKHPADIIFLGIGDNGHLAFNEPHVADFNDPYDVKTVEIDEISKRQQVNAGNFSSMEKVLSLAYTLTIPALLRSKKIICCAPTAYKAEAVRRSLYGPMEEACPASSLRTHANAALYLDTDSARHLTLCERND